MTRASDGASVSKRNPKIPQRLQDKIDNTEIEKK